MTFNDFVGGAVPQADNPMPMDDLLASFEWNPASLDVLNDGYATATVQGSTLDCVLLYGGVSGQREVIGFYQDRIIYVAAAHRKRWPTEELMLRCLNARPYSASWQLTRRGFDLLKRVHELSVRRAVNAGADVPDVVLKDYGLAKS